MFVVDIEIGDRAEIDINYVKGLDRVGSHVMLNGQHRECHVKETGLHGDECYDSPL